MTWQFVKLSGYFLAAAGIILRVATIPGAQAAVTSCGPVTANPGGVENNGEVGDGLAGFVDDLVTRLDAGPGIAIAVVKGGRVAFSRGYGFLDLAKCTRVSPDTQFYIKSTTKTLTGLMAALLAAQGTIDLDAPIADYLPDLRLPEGVDPAQVSLRDHLNHDSGYFDGGLNYRTAFPGNLPISEYVAHLNTYARAVPRGFHYSNVGYLVASAAIERKTGRDWRDLLRERLLAPLSMDRTVTRISDVSRDAYATSYLSDGGYRPTVTKAQPQMHAAGGVISTANDLSRIVLAYLGMGRIDGRQVIAHKAVADAQSPQIMLEAEYRRFKRHAYGLGLYIGTLDGETLLHHFGGETHLSFAPDHDIGVVVLTNEIRDGSLRSHHIAALIYDYLLGRPDLDANVENAVTAALQRVDEVRARDREQLVELRQRAREEGGPDRDVPVAGRYINHRLGEMQIDEGDGVMHLLYGVLDGSLEHVEGNAYLADFGMWGELPGYFRFRRDDQTGAITLDWDGRIFEKVDG